jgi:transcription elongation factor Elf1
MSDVTCPICGKRIMSTKEVERILRDTSSKVLLSRCLCGAAFEIRSPTRNVFDISTSSGKRRKHLVEDTEESL